MNASDDTVDLASVLEREAINCVQGVAQPAEWIRAEAAVFGDGSGDLWMRDLEQQRARASCQKNGDLTVDAPGHAVRPKQSEFGARCYFVSEHNLSRAIRNMSRSPVASSSSGELLRRP